MPILVTLLCLWLAATCAASDAFPPELLKQLQTDLRADLIVGNTDQARNRLEQASSIYHSAAIELGLIQTLMQAGEYNHALSAAAHTQAEHPDDEDATIFLAWLLILSGQYQPAQQLLEQTIARYPQLNMINKLHQQVRQHAVDATQINTNAIQLYPYSAELPGFRVKQAGVLLGNGQYLVTPRFDLRDIKTIKLRDARGKISEAMVEAAFKDPQLLLLKIKQTTPKTLITKTNTPRPGLPLYIIGYLHRSPSASWPLLYTAIPGIPSTGENLPINIHPLLQGAGAYNPNGDLSGIVANPDHLGRHQDKHLVIPLGPAVEFLALPQRATAKASALTGAKATADIYEAALATTVQILVENR